MTKTLKTPLLASVLIATSNLTFADNKVGEKTYNQVCSACHQSGVSGAPIFGKISAWSARITKGMPALYSSAINGTGAMPAKGGQSSISDKTIKSTVDFMVNNSIQLTF